MTLAVQLELWQWIAGGGLVAFLSGLSAIRLNHRKARIDEAASLRKARLEEASSLSEAERRFREDLVRNRAEMLQEMRGEMQQQADIIVALGKKLDTQAAEYERLRREDRRLCDAEFEELRNRYVALHTQNTEQQVQINELRAENAALRLQQSSPGYGRRKTDNGPDWRPQAKTDTLDL